MRRSECPIAASLDILGDRWTLVVLRDVLLDQRYASYDIAAAEGIASNIRADRLERLVTAGLLERHTDPTDGRRRNYFPTEKALGLIPVLVDLIDWGEANTGVQTSPELTMIVKGIRADRDKMINYLIATARENVERHKNQVQGSGPTSGAGRSDH